MSAFVSVKTFGQYNKIAIEENADELFEMYLSASQNVIENYLGYCLEKKQYEHTVKTLGANLIALKAMPISNIEIEASQAIDIQDTDKNILAIQNTLETNTTLKVKYTAGYTTETIPSLIKLTILRIASTMASEEGGDIAITGKTFGTDGGRTFVSTRDYSKFLKEIDAYRILQ